MEANGSNQVNMTMEYGMKAAGLRAALKFMQKEVSKENNLPTNQDEITSMKEKLCIIKEQIVMNHQVKHSYT